MTQYTETAYTIKHILYTAGVIQRKGIGDRDVSTQSHREEFQSRTNLRKPVYIKEYDNEIKSVSRETASAHATASAHS